ncbi:sucrase ferredoxin [uncultured Rothia sp.]|uniref:sucrase ferredoxin n=1 Tax=uncultured Rothia sp. TaxID=316088 RepID=UPI0028ECFD0B|nr:sucrase ferredoxin [uncultured Rothia sp.]
MTESCTPATPEPRATNPAELKNLRAAHADELSSRTRATKIPEGSCSLYDDEALGGTAGRATAWLALEHVGQWGRDVLDGSALGEELSAALGEAVSQAGLKFLLIRQAGREGRVLHGAPDASGAPTHRVLYALCTPGEEKLYSFSVSTPEQLLELPLDNPQELIQVTGAELMDSPAILVCTHSKRDRCCALRGRPIAAHLADILPPNVVWECSHTGGHRFAPVGIMLPTGYTYGRLSEPSALAAYLSLAGRSIPSLHGLRGRSTDTPVEQAAEVAVRLELEKKGEEVTSGGLVSRETSVQEALSVLREAGINPSVDTSELSIENPTMEAALTSHTDGRTWVTFFERVTLEPRPNSCGKGPADAFSRELLALHQL